MRTRQHVRNSNRAIKQPKIQSPVISQSGIEQNGLVKINAPPVRNPSNIGSKMQLAYYAAQLQAPPIK